MERFKSVKQQLLIAIIGCGVTYSLASYGQEETPAVEALSITAIPEGDTDAREAAAQQAAMMNVPMLAFRECTARVIGGGLPASEKRAELDRLCVEERAALVEVLPEELQEYILLNIDRRIDNVLQALIASEMVLVDIVEDTADIVEALMVDEQIVE